jgi:hypothetical protein
VPWSGRRLRLFSCDGFVGLSAFVACLFPRGYAGATVGLDTLVAAVVTVCPARAFRGSSPSTASSASRPSPPACSRAAARARSSGSTRTAGIEAGPLCVSFAASVALGRDAGVLFGYAAYHLRCLEPARTKFPAGHWACFECFEQITATPAAKR